MILTIDLTGKEFVVTLPPRPKVDQNGVQRAEKHSGEPMWATQVVVTDPSGGEIIQITTAGKQPDLATGDIVTFTNLVAIPWHTNGRTGVAYRADSIGPEEEI